MVFGCHVVCYPWDLLDEGVDHVLDRLQGQVGATGLTLIVACDELEQFRPHRHVEPKIYRTSGGVYFQPNSDKYQATRLKPPLWDQHRKRDVVAQVSEGCAERELDLRLSIRPFHSRRLVSKHPEVACKNAYGVSSRSALCLANPDSREYFLSLVRDLSCYDNVSAIVIEEVHWPAATDFLPYMDAQSLFDSDVVSLLNLCFGESSLQAAANAEIDGQAALRCARSLLDQLCQEGLDIRWDDLLDEYPAVARYIDWAESIVSHLFSEIKRASSKLLVISFRDAIQCLTDFNYAGELITSADKTVLSIDDLEQVIGQLSQGDSLRNMITPNTVKDMELLLPLDEGSIDDAAEVVRHLTWSAEAGASGITVSHYGAILENQFDWVYQGLRSARRLS